MVWQRCSAMFAHLSTQNQNVKAVLNKQSVSDRQCLAAKNNIIPKCDRTVKIVFIAWIRASKRSSSFLSWTTPRCRTPSSRWSRMRWRWRSWEGRRGPTPRTRKPIHLLRRTYPLTIRWGSRWQILPLFVLKNRYFPHPPYYLHLSKGLGYYHF